jgi:hypothetical protein
MQMSRGGSTVTANNRARTDQRAEADQEQRRIRSGCCACAASGHVMAEPATTLMKARRRIACPPKAQDYANWPVFGELQQGFSAGEMGFRVELHRCNVEQHLSRLGQKRTCRTEIAMSALPLKADIRRRHRDVSFGPKAEVAVISSVELIVQPDAHDVVRCCRRYRLTRSDSSSQHERRGIDDGRRH